MTTQEIIQKLTPFEIQLIDDLWEDYMYNNQNADDPYIDICDQDDIGYFREWLKNDHTITAFDRYLPQSDSELADIVRYCVQHTQQ